jgi:serine/threonine protein kinase
VLTLPSLDNIELLLENEHSITCRATSRENNTPSLYKILKKEYRSSPFSSELKREFELCSSINSEMAITMVKYLTIDATPAIAMENFDGSPLLESSGFDNYSLEMLLTLATSITSALEDIHRNNVVICNLNPHQILYNPTTRKLKLTDFSLAQNLPIAKLESYTLPIPTKLLPYISPEQTGRLNRDVDHRSDFYSLGVCLYQLFSGTLPFTADKPTEYIHLHIAKDPIPPHEANEAVPQMISRIILKLLDKTPENRYQSCKGILHDLGVCLNSIKESGAILDFDLGEKDISEIFKLSEKLYGREEEIAFILNEFENIQGGESRMLFIAGTTGMGKSSLANSLRKPVDQQRGYFLSGKFDQVPCDIPYMPIITAFQGFINQILAEGENAVQRWKTKILSLIGSNGKIIIDVIPEVEFIIGKQSSLPDLSPEENENRFSRTLSTFIHACSSRDTPLVLFLDDMQWSDLASLRFIEDFLVRQKTDFHRFFPGKLRQERRSSACSEKEYQQSGLLYSLHLKAAVQ